METIKVKMNLPKIEGYEYTGELRVPEIGEYILDGFGSGVMEVRCTLISRNFILKPVERWIVPTKEYIQKYYKWGDLIEARFRDYEDRDWSSSYLIYIDEIRNHPYREKHCGTFWKYCEIKAVD